MSLVTGARAVVTDSGGVQEETTYLGIPCFTLRESTERPITVTEGTNRLATAASLTEMLKGALNGHRPHARRPEYWDGQAAQRCVADLRRRSGR
jgi:UDP-N-acetylglucosamine 2-epimerase (non-hydrolysing)